MLLLVRGNLLSLPEASQNYLLETGVFNFSVNELENILISSSGNTNLLPLLLAIYWGYFIFVFFGITALFSMSFVAFTTIMNTSVDKSLNSVLFDVCVLSDNLMNYTQHPNLFAQLKLQLSLLTIDIYSFISPIDREWYEEERHQWLSISTFSKETKSILFALSKFKNALRTDLKNKAELSDYLPLIAYIELFLLSIANRTSKGKYEIIDLDKNINEFEILHSFASSARPIILRSNRSKQKSKEELKLIVLLKQVVQSSVVKFALSISGTAAAVMLLGVLLFKLEAPQAFLTWFTVTFGSLSISVGAATFQQIGKSASKQQTKENDE